MLALPKAVQLPRNEKVQVIGPTLLESQNMIVFHEMDTVVFEIGHHRCAMDYPTAIKLSALLRTHAKQAKKFAGDHSKHWTSESILTDAEENYRKGWT
jgi:hypothetical protein